MRIRILIVIWLILVIAHPFAFSAGDSEDFKYALAMMSEREEYQLAGELFERFIKANPDHELAGRSLFYLAGCYSRLQKDMSAGDTYKSLIMRYPAVDERLLVQALAYGGDAYFRAGAYEKAAQMYSQLLDKYAGSEQAEACLYWRAESYAQLAQKQEQKQGEYYNQAVEGFDNFLKSYSQSKMRPEALYSAGLSAYDARDYQRAREYLQRLADEYPKDVRLQEAIYHAADSCYWLEDYLAAERGFTRLIGMFADGKFLAEARAGLGWCAYARSKYAQAAREFSEAARLYTNVDKALDANFDAAVAYELAGEKDAAAEEFLKVADSNGHRRQIKALVRLGALNRAQAQIKEPNEKRMAALKEARGHLLVAYGLLGNESDSEVAAAAAVMLGETCYDLGEYTAAAEYFSAAAVRWPQERYSPFALYQLSLSLAQQKEYQRAAEAIRALLLNYPQSELRLQSAYAMADFQQALGDKEKSRLAYKWLAEEAVSWVRQNISGQEKRDAMLVQANNLAARALLRLGELHYAEASEVDCTLAAEYFGQLCEQYAGSAYAPAAYLRLGEIAEKGGDFTGAAGKYESALTQAECLPEITIASEEVEDFSEVALYAAYRLAVVRVLLAQRELGAMREEKLTRSLTLVQDFIRNNSKNKGAQKLLERMSYYRAELLYALGRKDEAIEDYRACYRAQENGELADAALFGLGWSMHDCGQAKESILAFKELVEKFPQSEYLPEALLQLAAYKRGLNDFTQALKEVDQVLAVEKFSNFHVRALIEKCTILGALGRHQDAVLALEKSIQKSNNLDDLPKLLYALSWAYWGMTEPLLKEASERERLYNEICAGAELQALSGQNKVLAQKAKKRWQEALLQARTSEDKMAEVLERLAADYPEFSAAAEVRLRLGEIAYDRGEYVRALENYRAVIEKGGAGLIDKARYRIAWCNLRQSWAAPKEQAKVFKHDALLEFINVCNETPQSPLVAECAWRAAELLREKGELQRALNLYERAACIPEAVIEIKSGAEYGRALCLLEMKEYGKAFAAFKDFIGRKENSELWHEANWGAGYAAFNLGASVEAQEYFNAAKAGDYGGEVAAKARYGLGLIALEQKNYRGAREEFRKVDVFHSQWQDIAALSLIKAAEASRELGENAAAAKDLQRIVRNYGATEHAKVAQALLTGERDQAQ